MISGYIFTPTLSKWIKRALTISAAMAIISALYVNLLSHRALMLPTPVAEILAVPDQANRTQVEMMTSCISLPSGGMVCSAVPEFKMEVVSIKELLPKLSEGQFVYNRITAMWRDIPETVLFKLKLPSDTPPKIPHTVHGEPVSGVTPVAPEMSVELRGTAGFKIEPSSPIKQRISDVEASSWQWSVISNKEGEGQLTLSVFIHVDDKSPYTLKTFEDMINVKVTVWQKTKDTISAINPLWALVAAVIPAMWSTYIWVRDRKWRPEDEQGKRTPIYKRRYSRKKEHGD